VANNLFTGKTAEEYDADIEAMYAPGVLDPTVDFLFDAARGGPALELAIGTGRVALPLSARGVAVHGIDISVDMVAQLRAKPGSDAIATTIGDFTSTIVGDGFSLVYLVFNTIGNVTTQDEQIECFHNAARHLAPGGRFVVELWIPDLRRFPPGAPALLFDVDPAHIGFDELDLATQTGVSRHFYLEDGHSATFETPFRYCWPSELDLMARLAGLQFRERWNDWNRSPFTSQSLTHVSVWEKPR